MRAALVCVLFVSLLLLGCTTSGQPSEVGAPSLPAATQVAIAPTAGAATPSPTADASALLNATPCKGSQNFTAPFGGPMCVGDAVKFLNQTVVLTALNATIAKFEAQRTGWDGKMETKDRASLAEFASKRLWAMEAGSDIGREIQVNVNRIYLAEDGSLTVDASITPELYAVVVTGCADFIVTYQTKPRSLFTQDGDKELAPYIKVILVNEPAPLLFKDDSSGIEAYIEPDGQHYWFFSQKEMHDTRAEMPFNFNSVSAMETISLKLLDNATLLTGPSSRVILAKPILLESNTKGMFMAGNPLKPVDQIYFETMNGRDLFWTVWYPAADGYYHSAKRAYATYYCENK